MTFDEAAYRASEDHHDNHRQTTAMIMMAISSTIPTAVITEVQREHDVEQTNLHEHGEE
jgi:hypothetical protein